MMGLIHNRKTFWIHLFLVGIPNAFALWLSVPLGVLIAAGFAFYEWIEYDDIKDHAYQDIQGWLVGLTGTGIALFWCVRVGA